LKKVIVEKISDLSTIYSDKDAQPPEKAFNPPGALQNMNFFRFSFSGGLLDCLDPKTLFAENVTGDQSEISKHFSLNCNSASFYPALRLFFLVHNKVQVKALWYNFFIIGE
jgi:hypothetical protein